MTNVLHIIEVDKEANSIKIYPGEKGYIEIISLAGVDEFTRAIQDHAQTLYKCGPSCCEEHRQDAFELDMSEELLRLHHKLPSDMP